MECKSERRLVIFKLDPDWDLKIPGTPTSWKKGKKKVMRRFLPVIYDIDT
jgi:hypothetical protein